MMEKYYQITGIRFSVSCPAEWMYREEGPLAEFLTSPGPVDQKIEFEIVQELAAPEGKCIFTDPSKRIFASQEAVIRYEGAVNGVESSAYLRLCRRTGVTHAQVKQSAIPCGVTAKLAMRAMEIEHQLAQRDGFLLHASCIRWQDRAILFTAPSETGKSTQAQLWCDHREAELLNGDRAVIRLGEDGPIFCGVPFSGSSPVHKNETLPLAAIVYLAQAPRTEISRLSSLQAFRRVWEGCSVQVWDAADVERASRAVLETVSRVPVYYLPCTPDKSAVEALEKEMTR